MAADSKELFPGHPAAAVLSERDSCLGRVWYMRCSTVLRLEKGKRKACGLSCLLGSVLAFDGARLPQNSLRVG